MVEYTGGPDRIHRGMGKEGVVSFTRWIKHNIHFVFLTLN